MRWRIAARAGARAASEANEYTSQTHCRSGLRSTGMGDQFDLFDLEFDEVSFVPGGDNPSAHIILSKSYIDPWIYETTTFDIETGEFVVEKREIPTDKRKELRDKGQALPDLSYPVEHVGDLNN